jgi:hypothetical protein
VTAPCRLSLVFASEAAVAVLIRRGPSEWLEIVKWNTAKDIFEDAQWLHGRIYSERCGLSPDGRLFVYFAAKHGRVDKAKGYRDTFTAVSRPPYLTALAMWPEGSTWGGGGRFIDNKTLRLAYGANGTRAPDGKTQLYMAPMPKHHPNHPPRDLEIQTDLERYAADEGFRDAKQAKEADWFGKDHSGRTIFTREGSLFYVNKNKRDVLLRDFNPDKRRDVPAPGWAQTWTRSR